MANIIEVCLLEGPAITKIYSFIGDESKTSQASKKTTTPVKFINEYIHGDDSISTIKYKIFNALDTKISVEEMYLFYTDSRHLNPRQLYNEMTQDEEYPLTSLILCSFMENINKKTKCKIKDDKEYEYDFLLNNINPRKAITIDSPIGVKCLLKRNYPFITNPFKCVIEDPKLLREEENSIQTTNANLLFQYDSSIKRIYLCNASTLLKINKNVSEKYLLKLYYPLLFREKIFSSDQLNENQPALIKKNKQEIENTKFILYNEKVDLFYNMFIKKKTNLEYLSKGISNIRFIIHPKNSDIFPIEILFKLIHSNQLMPFIKYNPGNKRENIYRLYTGDNIATNGKKIPILYTQYGNKKNKIKQLSKELATKKRVAFYITIPINSGKQELICEFSDKGDIYINIDFTNPVTINDIESLVRDAINKPILEKIYDFLSQSGYTYILFDKLSDTNIEITNITYIASVAHNKKIDLNKYASCISSIFTINQGIIKKSDDIILLTYKRVSNYKKMNAIQTFISDNMQEHKNHQEIIKELELQFDKTHTEAAAFVGAWISESQVLVDAFENKKIFKNSPGFPVFINSAKILYESVYKQTSIIKIENINNLDYLNYMNIYIDSLMRLVIDKKSSTISSKNINKLCNKTKINESIEMPAVIADVEMSLIEKINKNDDIEESEKS